MLPELFPPWRSLAHADEVLAPDTRALADLVAGSRTSSALANERQGGNSSGSITVLLWIRFKLGEIPENTLF